VDYAPEATFVMGSGNVTLYARWAINRYSVYFDAQGGSAVLTQTIKHGDTVAPPVVPTKRSYTFTGWFKEAACKNLWVFANEKIYADDTLFAKWVIMDADGNIYTEVTIGTQVWMVENLKTTKYSDGIPIPLVEDNTAWSKLTTAGYCWFDNDTSLKNIYGGFYNWYAVNTEKLAPSGWHIPTNDKWKTLGSYLGGDSIVGPKIKSVVWSYHDYIPTNETGFTAIGTNCRFYDGNFWEHGPGDDFAVWWSTTQYNDTCSWSCRIWCSGNNLIHSSDSPKREGYTIRCLRDY
jgi:uncharacterized protein (TIGR02145 family)/uncharacterized repeat protein (TIGR02543 family)